MFNLFFLCTADEIIAFMRIKMIIFLLPLKNIQLSVWDKQPKYLEYRKVPLVQP